MNVKRKPTKKVQVGSLFIGGDAPISIQSMTKTDTRDILKTVHQIKKLEEAGCEIIRCAVPDMEAAEALAAIKKNINLPLVADIHFDYRLALKAIESGVDKVRLNPGNIGDESRIKKVVEKAKERGVAIRIGVNSGSLEKDLLEKYEGVTPEAMVESALRHIALLESLHFESIVVSLKTSDIDRTLQSYRFLSEKVSYPLHIGLTESGSQFAGSIRSAVGLGILLSEGIGDTLRISLTADPVQEVKVGKEILRSFGHKRNGVILVSCPICGRCNIDMEKITLEIEQGLEKVQKPLKIAIMGCAVNGPGEAKEADLGITGGKGEALIYKKGEILRKVQEEKLVKEFLKEVRRMLAEKA